ncbi:FAD-dependent oxidoreductase, partial [Escherichia coli]
TRHNYDQLVFAVGSQAIRLPVPGADLPGVMVFRALDDVAAMKASVQPGYAAVVIGGGLLGIEAASGLARRGAKVTLLHVMDRLMERQLDARGAAFLLDALRRRGIRVILKAQTQAIT